MKLALISDRKTFMHLVLSRLTYTPIAHHKISLCGEPLDTIVLKSPDNILFKALYRDTSYIDKGTVIITDETFINPFKNHS